MVPVTKHTAIYIYIWCIMNTLLYFLLVCTGASSTTTQSIGCTFLSMQRPPLETIVQNMKLVLVFEFANRLEF